MKSYIMINDDDIMESYSISRGLDYPGIVPFHAYLHSINRVIYDSITDFETIEAFKLLSKKKVLLLIYQ